MSVPVWVWAATTAGLVLLVLGDLVLGSRRRKAVTVVRAACRLGFYVGLAVVFGLGIWVFAGGSHAAEFFGGYLTEYSLSVDNLFVFAIILAAFRVPAPHQERALLIGIVVALILRAAFITAGAVAINALAWIFYLFGAFLVYTAVNVARQGPGGDEEWTEPRVIGLVRRLYPTTEGFHGAKLTVRIDGRRWFTPMLFVTLAIGVTDLLFALDSIPAIFGITQQPFLVFTANAFALMALRVLYFLLGELLKKLIYLSYGLAAILAFIGVKLVFHALHENDLGWVNGGDPVPVPEFPVSVTLAVIAGILVLTTAASLIAARRDPAHEPALVTEAGRARRRASR
ncbi:TerC/Alx family metal homeostasis membrane protein [Amycolatopsis acidicola]|uniref:TerC/Alx family metal homeostasis membrane protein n=1 Tax=Amycolatopsis acidicola TaxID=2596893 RepID=A0A5N0UKI2_9PSEU|nr:TerC/Alx family metal homeostasis membrane protein [Amycolatopsis acidicola]KAA9149314.1 TerC/Alx family metal homeostasis membrane protein [Amycolatopsis acidicola]